jgi:hypothetical protein
MSFSARAIFATIDQRSVSPSGANRAFVQAIVSKAIRPTGRAAGAASAPVKAEPVNRAPVGVVTTKLRFEAPACRPDAPISPNSKSSVAGRHRIEDHRIKALWDLIGNMTILGSDKEDWHRGGRSDDRLRNRVMNALLGCERSG